MLFFTKMICRFVDIGHYKAITDDKQEDRCPESDPVSGAKASNKGEIKPKTGEWFHRKPPFAFKGIMSGNGQVPFLLEIPIGKIAFWFRPRYTVWSAFHPGIVLVRMELWNRKIRESMIMATLLAPVDKFSRANALKWIGEIAGLEMAEQLSMNLLSKLPFCGSLAVELTASEKEWERIIGFMTAVRIYVELTDNEAGIIVRNGFASDVENSYFLAVSVARSTGRMSRKGSAIASEIAGLLHDSKWFRQMLP